MFKNYIKKIAKYILLMGFILNNTVLVFSMESISEININTIKSMSNIELINNVTIGEVPLYKILTEFDISKPSLSFLIRDFNEKDANQIEEHINQTQKIEEAIKKLDDIFEDKCQISNMASKIAKSNHELKDLLNDKSIKSLYIGTLLVSCLYISSFLEGNSKNFSIENQGVFMEYLNNCPEINIFDKEDLFNSELSLNNLPKLYKEIAKRSYDAFLHQRLIDNNIELEDLFNSTVTKKKMEDEQEKIDLILDLLNSSKEERQKKIKERNKPIKKQNSLIAKEQIEQEILEIQMDEDLSDEAKDKMITEIRESRKYRWQNGILSSEYEDTMFLMEMLTCYYAVFNKNRFSIIQMQLCLIEQKNQINLIEQENFIDN